LAQARSVLYDGLRLLKTSGASRYWDWRLPRQARRERLDQQFQIAFIDNGDGVFRAMSVNVVFTLVGVTLLSRPDFPIVIDL